MTNSIGIYIHIPFCRTKCNYCNFYSLGFNEELKQQYCDKIISDITRRGRQIARPVCSVYIGGGTPSVMTGAQISAIIFAVKNAFNVDNGAEITVEVNPGDDLTSFLSEIKAAGCNRLSMGLQSGNDDELRVLGRRHSIFDAEQTFYTARKIGFDNISVDLMIGLPDSSSDTLDKSIDVALKLAPEHISSYILKIEQGTPFGSMKLNLPNDDDTADQYLLLCDRLRNAGYNHYEISNFAKENYEGRHNLNYWKCQEYLGFGPSAHSFFEGERFYYQNDLAAYMQNCEPCSDGNGGNEQEYIMLALRISDGIDTREFENKFSKPLPSAIFEKARLYEKNGLCIVNDNRIHLTDKGMLVSNSIITSFTEEL